MRAEIVTKRLRNMSDDIIISAEAFCLLQCTDIKRMMVNTWANRGKSITATAGQERVSICLSL